MGNRYCKTTGAPLQVNASADKKIISKNGEELCFITIRIADANGVTVPRTNHQIKCSISGAGEIVATDNGAATSFVPFQSKERAAFNGLALLIVKAKKGQTGEINITIESENLKRAKIKISSK